MFTPLDDGLNTLSPQMSHKDAPTESWVEIRQEQEWDEGDAERIQTEHVVIQRYLKASGSFFFC